MDSEITQAILLGILQGLTEFLPVSSSGHLEIGKVVLGSRMQDEESLLMTVVLHAATAISTLVVFQRDVRSILAGLLKFERNEEWEFSLKILLSMVPAVVVGLAWEDQIESLFSGNMLLVGSMLLLTGGLLLLADRAKHTDKQVGYVDALIVGVAQAIAILPGVSRSGATISTSVLLGIDRMQAARFSFLMVIPLILGKIAKDLLSGDLHLAGAQVLPLAAGFVAAFVTGILACKWMIQLVKNAHLWWFTIYCLVVGLMALAFAITNQAPAPAVG